MYWVHAHFFPRWKHDTILHFLSTCTIRWLHYSPTVESNWGNRYVISDGRWIYDFISPARDYFSISESHSTNWEASCYKKKKKVTLHVTIWARLPAASPALFATLIGRYLLNAAAASHSFMTSQRAANPHLFSPAGDASVPWGRFCPPSNKAKLFTTWRRCAAWFWFVSSLPCQVAGTSQRGYNRRAWDLRLPRRTCRRTAAWGPGCRSSWHLGRSTAACASCTWAPSTRSGDRGLSAQRLLGSGPAATSLAPAHLHTNGERGRTYICGCDGILRRSWQGLSVMEELGLI